MKYQKLSFDYKNYLGSKTGSTSQLFKKIDLVMAYLGIFCHQKLINGYEKIPRVTVEGIHVNFSICLGSYASETRLESELEAKKRQN